MGFINTARDNSVCLLRHKIRLLYSHIYLVLYYMKLYMYGLDGVKPNALNPRSLTLALLFTSRLMRPDTDTPVVHQTDSPLVQSSTDSHVIRSNTESPVVQRSTDSSAVQSNNNLPVVQSRTYWPIASILNLLFCNHTLYLL